MYLLITHCCTPNMNAVLGYRDNSGPGSKSTNPFIDRSFRDRGFNDDDDRLAVSSPSLFIIVQTNATSASVIISHKP